MRPSRQFRRALKSPPPRRLRLPFWLRKKLLSALRPQFAKLEGEIVRAAGRSVQSSAPTQRGLGCLAEAAIAIGSRVVAAGIESPEDLKVAQEIGASLFSGFLLCRPRRL